MKLKLIAFLCAFTLLFQGCAINNSNPSETENLGTEDTSLSDNDDSSDASGNIDEVAAFFFTYETIYKTYEAADGSTILSTEYDRPTITIPENDAATQKINDFFIENEKDFGKTAASYYRDAKSMYVEDASLFSEYYLSVSFETFRCDNAVLSIRRHTTDYSGGAHGNYSYTGLNFDLRTGELLSLDHISNEKAALLTSATAYIETQLTLPAYAESIVAAMDTPEALRETIENDVLTNDTWYFTNSGLTFISNIYVLTPYAGGAIFFTVPYQQLEGLQPEYQYNGPYELSGPIGSTLSADLDSDENVDAIFYNATYIEETNELSLTLIINGTDFSALLQNESCPMAFGAASEGIEYYLIDLDTTDEFIELAILSQDYNDISYTHFFRYDRGTLTLLGSIPDLLSDPTFHNYGDGTFIAEAPLALLETLRIPITYQLTDKETMEVIPEEWYYLNREGYAEEFLTHNLLQDVMVYTERDLHADTIMLSAADGPVEFPATDNEHWVMLKTAAGDIYYLYLEDFSTLESGQLIWDVFENLILAG